jgi:hypothetical protein
VYRFTPYRYINMEQQIKTTLILQLTKSEKVQIEILAKKLGLSVSEYVRQKSLNI